jgi:hypothetical protein
VKRGTKVKVLAASLGTTSRAVVDRCRAEGWAVQNSASRLTDAQADEVRRWFQHPDDESVSTQGK